MFGLVWFGLVVIQLHVKKNVILPIPSGVQYIPEYIPEDDYGPQQIKPLRVNMVSPHSHTVEHEPL